MPLLYVRRCACQLGQRKSAFVPRAWNTAFVLVRLDADLWNQDAATMRAKLTPPV